MYIYIYIYINIYIYIIVISHFILPGTFRYIGIWRSCNCVCLCFFVYILREGKCKYIIIYIIYIKNLPDSKFDIFWNSLKYMELVMFAW